MGLTHEYEEWKDIKPNFKYHGHNTYAPLLSDKYRQTFIDGKGWVDTFDFIFLQFYESYSHVLYNLTINQQQNPNQYFLSIVQRLTNNGWMVQFENEPNIQLRNQVISVPKSKFVLGFANGWAKNSEKSLFLKPEQISEIYSVLDDAGLRPRGCGFWNMKDEGLDGVYFARGLNSFLHTRKSDTSEL